MREEMIPVLPCVSLADTFAFYRLLGFEPTYEQHRPYVYGATKRGDLQVHFVGARDLDPTKASTTCLAIVPEVEALHAGFAAALRAHLGKLPVAGVPRITRMKPGQGRFTVVDPNGNSLVFIKHGADEDDDPEAAITPREGESRIARALRAAARFRDFKNDDRGAAKILDVALGHADGGSSLERARALVARIELAVVLDEAAVLPPLRAELAALALTEPERAEIEPELARVQSLEQARR